MDLRQILDVGASPQAPPGKKLEAPPPKDEFEKTLQTARKEETPGEVAEKEPNAQLQTLDSEKKETGKKAPDNAVVATTGQIPIDPSLLLQQSAVTITQLLATSSAPIAKPDLASLSNLVKIVPAQAKAGVGALTASDTRVEISATLAQAEVIPDINLDATNNQALTALVASAFEGKITNPLNAKSFVAIPQQLDVKSAMVDQKPSFAQLIPNDTRAGLNVTNVQSTTTPIAQLNTTTKAIENQTAVAVKEPVFEVTSKDVKPVLIGTAVVELTTHPSKPGSENQGSDTKEKSKDNSETLIPQLSANSAPSDVSQDAKPVTAHQLTTAERQAAVDIISRKIDELAAKSIRNEVRVEMHPPELGSVVVNIRKDMAGITATLNASNEPLRQALHDSRNDLAGALTDRNVGQVKVEVRGASADTMNMGQQFNQAQSQQQQNQQNNQAKTTSQFAGRLTREESVEQPSQMRLTTTLLDMEI
jgi:flagellar hook-length control protein FliK